MQALAFENKSLVKYINSSGSHILAIALKRKAKSTLSYALAKSSLKKTKVGEKT